MPRPTMEASHGNLNQPLLWPIKRGGLKPISKKDEDYFSIYACRWFVNDQSQVLRKCVVSGVLSCTVQTRNGPFQTKIVLPPYEAKNGLKTPPIFEKSIIPLACYCGGDINVELEVYRISEDTTLATLLRKAGEAGLAIGVAALTGVTGGAVVAAAAAAGVAMAGEATHVLQDSKRSSFPYFPPGTGITIKAAEITQGESYILIHRGTTLDPNLVSIDNSGPTLQVLYNGQALEDGIWVLLNIHVTSGQHDGDPRPWENDKDNFVRFLARRMFEWKMNLVSQEALKQEMSGQIAKDWHYIDTMIARDPVLTNTDKDRFSSELQTVYATAKDAVDKKEPNAFGRALQQVRTALITGTDVNAVLPSDAAAALDRVVMAIGDPARRGDFRRGLASRLATVAGEYHALVASE